MTTTVLDATTRAATVAATTQDAQRAAQWAPFGVGDVTVRHMAGAVIAEVCTHGPAVLNSLTPLGATLGALSASTVNVSGATITSHVFVTAGGTAIFSVPTTDVTLIAPTTLTGRRINLAALLLNANSALPLAPTYLLTFTADDAATVSVAAAGSIVNTGTGACAWSIAPPSGVAVSPSSGTLAAGATQALAVTASAAATYSLTLVSAGTTITNATQSIVVSLAPATSLTLSVPSTGTATVAVDVTVTPNGPVAGGGTATLATTAGTLGSTTLTWTTGESAAKTTTLTLAAAGSASVTMTTGTGLAIVGSPAPFTAAAYTPSWIAAQALNTWGTIPASNTLASLNPDSDPAINPNYPAAAPWRSTGNWVTIVTAWNGMAWDESSATGWWVDAGGHNDQHANGVIRLDLNTDAPYFTRIRKPSGAVGEPALTAGNYNPIPQTAEFSDGRPRAKHTVNMAFYWPGVGPGNVTEILLSPTGGAEFGRLRPHVINEITGERSFLGANKTNEASGGWCSACYDPTRNVVWKMPTSSSTPFSKWGGPSADAWTDVGASNYFAGSVSMCYIPGHDVILVGNGGNDAGSNQTIVGGWAVFDPATGVLHRPTFTGAPATAPNGDASGLWPGICQPRWAPSLGAALAWDMDSGHTTKVLRITPPASGDPRTSAWTIDYLPISGSNAVTPSAAAAAGTYGRFWVWDAKRVCGVLNSASDGGFFFRYG